MPESDTSLDLARLRAWTVTGLLICASLWGSWWWLNSGGVALTTLVEQLEAATEARPWLAALALTAIFAISTALTLPTATVLCLVAGYLFGTWVGSMVALVGLLTGALITFVSVRFLIGQRLSQQLVRGQRQRLLEFLERDSFFYLVAFRIIPVAPYFVVNAAGAMLRITPARFLAATTLGLVPLTLIYASVGAGFDALLETGTINATELLRQPRIGLPLLALLLLLLGGAWARIRVLRIRARERKIVH